MALKWGIVSVGSISHEFLDALETLNKDDHQVVAVSARDLCRAKDFANQFGIPKSYGSYLELAEDPQVEVVYIGTLNPLHFEVSLMMIEHGKHVLIEKPMCMNEKQTQELITNAKQKNVFLMEGLWTRLLPSYEYIRQQILNGKLGEIVSVEAEFGNPDMSKVERITNKDLGGGTILDVGVYVIQLCQWMFRRSPQSIKATVSLNDDGVDLEMAAELTFGGNQTAHIRTSALVTLSNVAKIIGTKGTIKVPVLDYRAAITDVDGTEKTFPLNLEAKHCGLRYQAEEVRKCIQSGKKESEFATHNDSLIIARIEDEIRKQIGVNYSADDE